MVFNVCYSDNLGDGLIAEAIEQGFARHRPGWSVETLDLAGRSGHGDASLRNRARALTALRLMPGPLRRQVVARRLGPRICALLPGWRVAIARADHVVIGGGHLFQDGDLNFPLKVGAVLALCREQKKPVSIHAVGVSKEWSPAGKRLFHRLLECDVRGVTVRDPEAQQAWREHFRGTRLAAAADLAPDPVIGWPATASGQGQGVGICVTHPGLLAYHGGSASGVDTLFAGLAAQFCEAGLPVTLFTNGAAEDEETLDRLCLRSDLAPRIATGALRRASRPRRPSDLVATIAPLSVIVAHRLHATILAYALGRPAIGLGWDRKLESFFALTGRSGFFVPAAAANAPEVAALVRKAMAEGLDDLRRQQLRRQADGALVRLAERIGQEAGAREGIR